MLGEVRACRACAGDFAHEPRPLLHLREETAILICGQAPGRTVHESGLAFDSPSGDRLRAWMGVDRATFYGHPAIGFAPMAFCYPGTAVRARDQSLRCARLWRRRLLAALPNVELTLLLGRCAQVGTLGDDALASMDQALRAWRTFAPGLAVLPHPSWRNTAWLKRNPWFEAETTPWLRARVAGILSP